MICMG